MRYYSIDILRMVAIFVMVIVHFRENLSGFNSSFAGFGAPLFAMLSGASHRLWVNGQATLGVNEEQVSKISIRRGLFVIGVGFAFNILVWLPEDTFNWDVLTFIGTALLILNVMRRTTTPIIALVAGISLLISPLLRRMANYDAYWVHGYFDGDLVLSDLAIGFLATGYFPVFPWIAYSLTGFAAAGWFFPEHENATAESNSPWPPVLLGAILAATSCGLLLAKTPIQEHSLRWLFGGWTMFPPTIEYVLATLGLGLMLWGILHHLVDRKREPQRLHGLFEIAKTFSRFSFTIYVLHHVVHLWPLWIFAMVSGQEATSYWMKAMSSAYSVPLAFTFLALCYGILRWLGPERQYGLESVMRWLCD